MANSKRIRFTILDAVPLHTLTDDISKQHTLFILAINMIDQSQHSVRTSGHTRACPELVVVGDDPSSKTISFEYDRESGTLNESLPSLRNPMRLKTTGNDQTPHLLVRRRSVAVEDSCAGGETGAVADG